MSTVSRLIGYWYLVVALLLHWTANVFVVAEASNCI